MTVLPQDASENPWDVFPHNRHIGTDDCGNEIVVDCSAGEDGAVFGLWHDPAAVVVLARSEALFREEAADFESGNALPPALARRINQALEGDEQGGMPREAAGQTLGPGYESWLSGLPAGAVVFDLRSSRPGTGFELGARTLIMRHPGSAVFATFEPPRPPGLLGRLLGRR